MKRISGTSRGTPEGMRHCNPADSSLMKKEIVKIDGIIEPPSPFSHVVKAGGFIFLSSQLSVDLKTHKILGGNIRKQTTQALENIKFLLESSGSSMENIVKVMVYMKDVKKDFKDMNEVYRKYFKKGQEPARVTVQALSPIEDIDIEIEAIAISNE
jgi:2-iminobutanoate/2-iminopropanoate deaminase